MFKKTLAILTLAVWFPLVFGLSPLAADQEKPWTDYPLIAHALGGINGLNYSNSHEAFMVNYKKGHRVFEVDLMLSKDQNLVARHDWFTYLQPSLPDNEKDIPLTVKQFKQYKIFDKYKPLSFRDLVMLLKQYPDVYLITDTKELDAKIIAKQFAVIVKIAKEVDPSLLDRIIPEIYNKEMLQTINNIYTFQHKIYSIYLTDESDQEVLKTAIEQRFSVVAMPIERANASFITMLNNHNILPYVYTTNKIKELEALKKKGVHGFYTDFIAVSTVNKLYP